MIDADAPDGLGPAAEEVRRVLAERIRSGDLRSGDRIGNERDLAAEFRVSRSTLRRALAALHGAGAVRRVTGRAGGTFVASGKVERDLSRIVGVPELLRDQGFTAGTRVVSASAVVADLETARNLGLEPGEFVMDVVRIRLADGVPISLERARLPARRFPDLIDQALSGSLYALMRERYGSAPVRCEERIEVTTAGDDEAAVLGVSPGVPLLAVDRLSWAADGAAVEFSTDLFRADRTRIVVRTPGLGAATGRPGVVYDLTRRLAT
jgi:GntR family transcriptional regulator